MSLTSEDKRQVSILLDQYVNESNQRANSATLLAEIGLHGRRGTSRGNLVKAAPALLERNELLRLLGAALAEPNVRARCEAIFAIGELAGADMVEPIIESLRMPLDQTTQAALRRALGKIGGAPAMSSLYEATTADRDAALAWLGLVETHTRDHESFGKEVREPHLGPTDDEAKLAERVHKRLVSYAASPDLYVRALATSLLGHSRSDLSPLG